MDPSKPEEPLTAAHKEAKAHGEPPHDWYHCRLRFPHIPALIGVEVIEIGSHIEGVAAFVYSKVAGPALDKALRELPASSVPIKGRSSHAARRQRGKEQPQKPVQAPKPNLRARPVTLQHPLLEAEEKSLDAGWLDLMHVAEITLGTTPIMIGTFDEEELLLEGVIACVCNAALWHDFLAALAAMLDHHRGDSHHQRAPR